MINTQNISGKMYYLLYINLLLILSMELKDNHVLLLLITQYRWQNVPDMFLYICIKSQYPYPVQEQARERSHSNVQQKKVTVQCVPIVNVCFVINVSL